MPYQFQNGQPSEYQVNPYADSFNGQSGARSPQSVMNAGVQGAAGKGNSKDPFGSFMESANAWANLLTTGKQAQSVAQAPNLNAASPLYLAAHGGQMPVASQNAPSPDVNNGGGGGGPYGGGTAPTAPFSPTPQGYASALGPNYSWLNQQPQLIPQFQQWAQGANFGQNPQDLQAYLWGMGLDPNATQQQEELALAEIFSRYPGQEWLQGRGDLIWAWHNDPGPMGHATNPADFTGWLRSKGFNGSAPNFAGALNPPAAQTPPANSGNPGTPAAPAPSQPTPPGQFAPQPWQPPFQLPGSPQGAGDYMQHIEELIRGANARTTAEGMRQLNHGAGVAMGDNRSGGELDVRGDYLEQRAADESGQLAEYLFGGAENQQNRALQDAMARLGLAGSMYGADMGLQGTLAGVNQRDREAILGYNAELQRIAATIYGIDVNDRQAMLNLARQLGPEYLLAFLFGSQQPPGAIYDEGDGGILGGILGPILGGAAGNGYFGSQPGRG